MAAGDFNASSMKGSELGTGSRLAAALCALAVILFTLSCREAGGSGPISLARSGFSVVAAPVRSIGSVICSPFTGIGNAIANITAPQETLTELQNANAELVARLAELEEAASTAERLQDLLDIKSDYKLDSTAASVISGSTDAWSSTIVINKGSTSGLAQGMPVMTTTGVIGQISECGPTSSVVRLITDEDSSVSAMIQSSRAQGMLRGSADGTLKLTLVGVDQTVEVGDLVITSGLGGVYPKGLPLGTVTNVERTTGALYYDITVRSFSTSVGFEEVLVITSLSADQQATAEDLEEADAQQTEWIDEAAKDAEADAQAEAEATSGDGE